jgi:hypothetical protein
MSVPLLEDIRDLNGRKKGDIFVGTPHRKIPHRRRGCRLEYDIKQ